MMECCEAVERAAAMHSVAMVVIAAVVLVTGVWVMVHWPKP